jgi:hypothetical protein
LENLEKSVSPNNRVDDESHLIETCHKLRKKTLQEFEVEDLRIMIGQNIGTKYLLPLAIEKLSADLFVEGDFYPGDLLKNVLHVDKKFWTDFPDMWDKVASLISDRQSEIESHDIATNTFYDGRSKSSR